MELPDPGMPDQPSESRNYFLAWYAVSLIQGQTILGTPIRHQTVINYLTASYQLLRSRNHPFNSEKDYIEIILLALANYKSIRDCPIGDMGNTSPFSSIFRSFDRAL